MQTKVEIKENKAILTVYFHEDGEKTSFTKDLFPNDKVVLYTKEETGSGDREIQVDALEINGEAKTSVKAKVTEVRSFDENSAKVFLNLQ
jgi:hypothetical protein